MKRWWSSTLYTCLGVVSSTLCAIVLAKLYTGTEWKIEAPLLFAIALVILASYFGAEISVAGSVLGAVVFAFFLYNPENSLRVSSETDRSTLAWMILISISLSYLLYPTRGGRKAGSGVHRANGEIAVKSGGAGNDRSGANRSSEVSGRDEASSGDAVPSSTSANGGNSGIGHNRL